MIESVLLDTNFLVGLVNPNDIHHQSANEYYKYFCEQGTKMYLSSIVLSEFTTKHKYRDLHIRKTLIPVSFNLREAILSGELKHYKVREQGSMKGSENATRVQIKDDIKILAQLFTYNIEGIATGDSKMNTVFDLCCQFTKKDKQFIDINNSYKATFGVQEKLPF